MGLSIHYQGKFKNAKLLPSMIEEVVDIAKTNGWEYFIFENEFPDSSFIKTPEKENLYGICVSPPKFHAIPKRNVFSKALFVSDIGTK